MTWWLDSHHTVPVVRADGSAGVKVIRDSQAAPRKRPQASQDTEPPVEPSVGEEEESPPEASAVRVEPSETLLVPRSDAPVDDASCARAILLKKSRHERRRFLSNAAIFIYLIARRFLCVFSVETGSHKSDWMSLSMYT